MDNADQAVRTSGHKRSHSSARLRLKHDSSATQQNRILRGPQPPPPCSQRNPKRRFGPRGRQGRRVRWDGLSRKERDNAGFQESSSAACANEMPVARPCRAGREKSYDAGSRAWNGMVGRRPAMGAFCNQPEDVQAAARAATSRGASTISARQQARQRGACPVRPNRHCVWRVRRSVNAPPDSIRVGHDAASLGDFRSRTWSLWQSDRADRRRRHGPTVSAHAEVIALICCSAKWCVVRRCCRRQRL